ncbi:SMP-30/gluconolactonase/LRE family protein [Burkholderia pseudomultivorans]|uniref:Gluconolaconase n=1 Tax=Burkholderia pseudomultivorans TaxID=1207504 RepID=A0A132EJR4_9BURK|nr:SMP-30/gluconolactonase/LRE family protein [Burkholderia pseudomultivorans]KWF33305.1 gluconolaconase [Burkholderia pseudomultivorans]
MQQTHPAALAALLVDSRNTLGEGAIWCDATHALYWTDIEGARLWRCRADGSDLAQWPMPERLACFALTNEPDVLLVGLATHLAFFDLRSGAFTRIVDVEPDLPTRLNDGRCDPFGAFVFGMKDEGGEPPRALGGFYRLGPDLTLGRLALPPAAIANSIAFSPDGARMYFCDSLVREIFVCDYRAGGDVANVRPFARLTDSDGDPDGSTIDRDGGLWNAQWGGRRVVRYGPDGVETARVTVPTAQPSCVTLDGEGRLYVTSARAGLSDDALARDAHAGGVFVAATRHAGAPTARFAGKPAG